MDLCNISVIRELMGDAGITFRKDFGQNFLINPKIPSDIADAAAHSPDTLVLEIGPGVGCLTQELAKRYKRVVAVEIDKGLIPILDKTLSEFDNVTVINDDIMKVDLPALVEKYACGMPVSVCANLPYYITTPILMRLLESGVRFEAVTVMVQNEVASRLCASAGSDDYGAISAVIAYFGEAKRLFRVNRGCFMPAPKVDSAVVRISLYREPKYTPRDERLFRNLIKFAFEMRRKTLYNALRAKLSLDNETLKEAIVSLGYGESVRGERLSVSDFVALSDRIYTDLEKNSKT
ncbi:MAG: 16S rRNA (adenine(1518)-N(6)/adenine(1519)-N(6))-dimethyltransferase RsmA [Clostridia bacterium]|nr:16S rRNA (adenine(1518)-N(6)/adenine(1519)-N(6))-dimethyltransferase RsmA [Clostridia bacterium]